MFVRRSTYNALQAAYQRVIAERDQAVNLAAERLTTVTRQAEKLTRRDDWHPTTPVREPQPPQGDAELRRRLDLAERARRFLDEQILPLQAANEAMAAELRDLREGSEAGA
ncbi:hypothetical protein SAMN04487981_101642 [Streptomyces sp. cf386]|uniref:hypothetical protein n=1 Tax=Streptomyces sp. cf386 TaxID=1761904 RepID=UPI0008835E96|nr:hypothetical protein [Streptomyces sp. cf386]SDM47488.1 hypothetical protein SAMN04487981_101642 [Streptomyces sp. cf386]